MTYDMRPPVSAERSERYPEPIDRRDNSGARLGDLDILHLAELVPILRQRLGIDDEFPDDAILASLKVIVARSSVRDRWRAAFDSNLGHWIAVQGRDLNTALNTLVSLLPKPHM